MRIASSSCQAVFLGCRDPATQLFVLQPSTPGDKKATPSNQCAENKMTASSTIHNPQALISIGLLAPEQPKSEEPKQTTSFVLSNSSPTSLGICKQLCSKLTPKFETSSFDVLADHTQPNPAQHADALQHNNSSNSSRFNFSRVFASLPRITFDVQTSIHQINDILTSFERQHFAVSIVQHLIEQIDVHSHQAQCRQWLIFLFNFSADLFNRPSKRLWSAIKQESSDRRGVLASSQMSR